MLHEQHDLALLRPIFGQRDPQIFGRMREPLAHHFSQTYPDIRTIRHRRVCHTPRTRTRTIAHRLQMTVLIGVQHRTNRNALAEIGIGFVRRNGDQTLIIAANILAHALRQHRHGLIIFQSEQ